VNVRHRDILVYYVKKILKFFFRVEFRILVKNEIFMKLTYSRSPYYKHADWKGFFVFKYPVICKQKISKLKQFCIEINVNIGFYVLTT